MFEIQSEELLGKTTDPDWKIIRQREEFKARIFLYSKQLKN
jgi:hypothetical protein